MPEDFDAGVQRNPNPDEEMWISVSEQTIKMHMVKDREAARFIYESLLNSGRRVAWFECGSVQEFLEMDRTLSSAPADADIFLFFTMGPGFISWDLIEMAIPEFIQETIFRLCPEGLFFHIARMGQAASSS